MTSQPSLEGGQPSIEVRFQPLFGRVQWSQIRLLLAGWDLNKSAQKLAATAFVIAGFYLHDALPPNENNSHDCRFQADNHSHVCSRM